MKVISATTIYIDNRSAISIAKNTGYSPRAKHIDLRYDFVCDHIDKGYIALEYVPSALQLADVFSTAPD